MLSFRRRKVIRLGVSASVWLCANVALAQDSALARANCPSVAVRVLGTERANVFGGRGSSGFSFSAAAAGREYLILKFELNISDSTAYPPLPYTRLRSRADSMFTNAGGGARTLSRTRFSVEHYYSVPVGTAARTLLLGRFTRPVSAPSDERPTWTTVCEVDLTRLSFKSSP
jgi:hypothetical protein